MKVRSIGAIMLTTGAGFATLTTFLVANNIRRCFWIGEDEAHLTACLAVIMLVGGAFARWGKKSIALDASSSP